MNANSFRIETIVPAIQTAVASLASEILGYLNQHKVGSLQSVVLISGAASLISSLANNIFQNVYIRYLAIPASVGLGVAAHRFFYPATSLNNVLDARGAIVLTLVLIAVRLAADNAHRLRKKVEEGAANIEEGAVKVEHGIEEAGKEAYEKAKEGIEATKAELAKLYEKSKEKLEGFFKKAQEGENAGEKAILEGVEKAKEEFNILVDKAKEEFR